MRASLPSKPTVIKPATNSRPVIVPKPSAEYRGQSSDVLPTGDQGGHKKIGKPYRKAGQWYYPKDDPDYDQIGYASWYGPQFHGKKTANGEIFNMNSLTAAHKTLALPSYARVTNLDNGRSIIVRINDRGPFVSNRIIDVSRRTAQILGFTDKGVTKVRIQAVDEYGNASETASWQPQKQRSGKSFAQGDVAHFIQIGAFSERQNAEKKMVKAKRSGVDAVINNVIISGRSLYRVRVGPFKSRKTADEFLRSIVNRGFFDAKVLSDVMQ